MLLTFNSNRVIEGKTRRPGDVVDVEDWRPLVESGAASLVEPRPDGAPDAEAAAAEDAESPVAAEPDVPAVEGLGDDAPDAAEAGAVDVEPWT